MNSPGRSARILVVVLGAVLAVGLSAQALTEPSVEEGWVQFIDAPEKMDAPGSPGLPLPPLPGGAEDPRYDARADIVAAWYKEDHNQILVRFQTEASGQQNDDLGNVESLLDFSFYAPHLNAWDDIVIAADDDGIQLLLSTRGGDETAVAAGAPGFEVMPESTAWDYEVSIRRDLISRGNPYIRGDAITGLSAQTKSEQSAAIAQDYAGGLEDSRLELDVSGNLPLPTLELENPSRWMPYHIRSDGIGHAVAVTDDGTIHVAYQAMEGSGYFGRTGLPAGIYHAMLVDGAWRESLLWEVPYSEYKRQPMGMTADGNVVHVVFHGNPDAGASSAADSLLHAQFEDDAWSIESVLNGLQVDAVYTNATGQIDVAAQGGRVATVVRPVDDAGVIVLVRDNDDWQVATHLEGTVLARVDFNDGDLVAVGIRPAQTEVHPEYGPMVTQKPTLVIAREADEFAPQTIMESASIGSTWNSVGEQVPFDVAILDGEPCVFANGATGLGDAAGATTHEMVAYSARLYCPESGLDESLPFVKSDHWAFQIARMETSGGDVKIMAEAPSGMWVGERSADGHWWWEIGDWWIGPEFSLLPDGRPVLGFRWNGGFGGSSVVVQHPDAHDDKSAAFFEGTAAEAGNALAPYRAIDEAEHGERLDGQANTQPGDGSMGLPPDAKSKKDSPGASLIFLAAALFVAVCLRRRRPQA